MALLHSRLLRWLLILLMLSSLGLLFAPTVLNKAGAWLIDASQPTQADVAVVLATGVDYYPRLMEAAHLYRAGVVPTVLLNGNRKSAALRALEAQGFTPACDWWADSVRILGVLGVPAAAILTVSAEEAYDTVSEAVAVGAVIRQHHPELRNLVITTSRFHTRRAGYIWRQLYADRWTIQTAAARDDPFSAEAWWRSGRQVRQLLAEYGAWGYYFWQTW